MVARTAPVVPPVLSKEALYGNLGVAYDDLKRAPSSEVSEWLVMGADLEVQLMNLALAHAEVQVFSWRPRVHE